MITISKVERKGKKLQLTFSDSTSLKINSEIYKKYKLVPGEQLEENFIEHLIKENEYFEAKISALRFLSIRNHFRQELKIKLLKKKYSEEVINMLLNELDSLGYTNDGKFAKQFLDEFSNKYFGPLKIKSEMIKRGLDRKTVDEVITKFFYNEELQIEKILQYLRKNKFPQTIKSKNELQKIYNHLISRGYTTSAVMEALRKKFALTEID